MTVSLNSIDDFSLATLERVAIHCEPTRLGAEAVTRIKAAHQAFKTYVTANLDTFIYGVTSDLWSPCAQPRGN